MLKGILAARQEGVRYIAAHPDEAAEIVARAYNGDKALYAVVFKRFNAIHYWSEGKLDVAAMNRMVEGLQIVGKQKGPVDWSKVSDPQFLPAQ